MADLSWQEEAIAAELAGALLSVASYCEFRPDRREDVRAAVAERIGAAEWALMSDLTAERLGNG